MFSIIGAPLLTTYGITILYLITDVEISKVERKKLSLLSLLILVCIVSNVAVFTQLGVQAYARFYPLLVHLPVFLAFSLISKFRGVKLFFALLTSIIMVAPARLVATLVGAVSQDSDLLYSAAWLISCAVMIVLVYKYFRAPFSYMLRYNDKGWLGFCAIPTIYYVSTYSSGRYNFAAPETRSTFINFAALVAITFLSYFLTMTIFKKTRENTLLYNEQALLNTQTEYSKRYIEQLKLSQDLTNVYRHDLRHHLQLINAYLASNNRDEVEHYMTALSSNLEDTVVTEFCANITANLILSAFVARAEGDGIILSIKAHIPSKTSVLNTDLCIVISNGLENALNATRYVEGSAKKEITLSCQVKNGRLLLRITNPFSGVVTFENGLPVTQSAGHGIGTKSIALITEKYNGMHEFKAENGMFSLSVIL